jgi:phosphate-selective porin
MGFVAALPVLSKVALATSAVSTISGIRQAGAAGKFNQAAANRTANVKEQEALALQNQLDFDLKQFDKDYIKLVGQTNVAISKSNVVLGEGTALRIARKNAEEAELQKNVMTYNSKVAQSQKIEDANFARIQGTMAKQQATMQKIQLASSFGSSLLTSGQTTKA